MYVLLCRFGEANHCRAGSHNAVSQPCGEKLPYGLHGFQDFYVHSGKCGVASAEW